MAKKKKTIKKPVKKTVSKKSTQKVIKKTKPQKAAPKKKAKVKTKAKIKAKISTKKVVKPLVIQNKILKNIDYTKAVTPLGERLLVRAVQAETMTAGGLYIPDTVDTKDRYVKAIVLAAGHGAKNKKGFTKPLDVQVGDTILFPAYASVRIQFNSEELHIVNESDVLGTV